MGRKGQAQRTKNNAKPSNSGRIAELVDHKGHQFSPPNAPADSTTPSSSGHFQNLSTFSIEMFIPDIDPNFQVVLKKMNKKDATTRFKALQELKDLCKGTTKDVLIQVLPAWARLYALLAIDVEHRVREAVQEVHRLIVSTVGRDLAPYLKQIAPLWFISQYDTYAPAASIASAAFQEAFPPHKMIEVISFCQGEILDFIKENLLNLTPQDLSKGDRNKEEYEARYDRIIISSLNGYALYLEKVPQDQIKKYESINKDIVSSNKFWKFSKYKTGGVRAAWFSLLSSMCKNTDFLLRSSKKNVTDSIIGSLDDHDPAVLSVVWEAALHAFTSFTDFWQHVNIDKFFLPKFCNILKHGGYGNATYIYPNILILINSIPKSAIKDNMKFYERIFTSFQEGMKEQLVVQSQSESEAVSSAYIECIKYLIMTNIEDMELCIFLVEKQLLHVVTLSLTELSYRHHLKPLFTAVSHLLIFWYKNHSLQSNYRTLEDLFWKKLSGFSSDNLKNMLPDHDNLRTFLSYQHIMFAVLSSPSLTTKKKLRVSFSTDIDSISKTTKDNANLVPMIREKSEFEKEMEDNVLSLVKDVLSSLYMYALDKEYKSLQLVMLMEMNNLIILMKDSFAKHMSCFEPKWSDSVLLWLKDVSIPMDHLLRIVFVTIDYLTSEEQVLIISEITKNRSEEGIIEALKLATISPNEKLVKWIQSDEMKDVICKIYDEIDFQDTSFLIKVNQFFALDANGDFLIGFSTVLTLINKIKDQMSFGNENDIQVSNEIVCILLEKLRTTKKVDLLFNILDIIFLNILHGQKRSIIKSWQLGVSVLGTYSLENSCIKEFLDTLSGHLTSNISTMKTLFDIKLAHNAVTTLLSLMVKDNKKDMSDLGISFVRTLLSSLFSNSFDGIQSKIEKICLIADAVSGKLSSEHLVSEDYCGNCEVSGKWDPLNDIDTLGFINIMNFVMKLLSSVFGFTNELDDENEEDANELNILPNLPLVATSITNEFLEYFWRLSYNLLLLKKMKTYYYCTKQYYDIEILIESFQNSLEQYSQELNISEKVIEKKLRFCYINIHPIGEKWPSIKESILNSEEQHVTQDISTLIYQLVSALNIEISNVQGIRDLVQMKKLTEAELFTISKVIESRFKDTTSDFNQALTEESGTTLLITAEVAHFLEAAIKHYPLNLSQNIWDFARISLSVWLKNISQSTIQPSHHLYLQFVTFTNAICKLLVTLTEVLSKEVNLVNYCEEWREVFSGDAYYHVCAGWRNTIGNSLSTSIDFITFLHILKLSETISVICDMDSFCILKPNTENTNDWINLIMKSLLSPCVPVQLTSYKLLLVMLPSMILSDQGLDETALEKISCVLLEANLIQTQTVFMAMLHDFRLGVSCSVAPFTDGYTYTLAYLLLWSVLVELCKESASSPHSYIYPLWIKEQDLVPHFIEGVTKLMPDSVLHYQETNIKMGQDLFTSFPSFTFDGWTSEKLSGLCCWLLTEVMACLPAVVRQWASEAEPKQLSFVDRLITGYISPTLSAREINAIKSQDKSFNNMKVYTQASVREVIAVYTVEESSTELVIQLANNHPLSPPKVDISKAMISSIQTRQWLKQLTIFLTHQNGSIWDGLILWKSNLDKKFEGIDECYICFSILHNTTHQLPKLSCHTCKKKFHSYCLYKWFSTSHKSTCPICRAIF